MGKGLTVNNFKAKNINIKAVNNHIWEPNNWVSQASTQNITGPVRTQKIKTNNLIINPNKNKLFNGKYNYYYLTTFFVNKSWVVN